METNILYIRGWNSFSSMHVITDAVDECTSEFDDCDENADCSDLPYDLYSVTAQPFSCKCKSGFHGNGTYCESKSLFQ